MPGTTTAPGPGYAGRGAVDMRVGGAGPEVMAVETGMRVGMDDEWDGTPDM